MFDVVGIGPRDGRPRRHLEHLGGEGKNLDRDIGRSTRLEHPDRQGEGQIRKKARHVRLSAVR